MFVINNDTKQINLTRGDCAVIGVNALDKEGNPYTFQKDDIVRFKVFKAKDCNCVELQKDVIITEIADVAKIHLTKEDTKIGDLINKPTDYWYEIELNPDTEPQTIIGYDLDGEKIFKLYPEGADINDIY